MTSGEKFEEIVRLAKGTVWLEVQRGEGKGHTYQVEFYRNREGGLYRAYGASFDEVVSQALEFLTKKKAPR